MHMSYQNSRSSPQAPSSRYGWSQHSLGRRLFASLTNIYTQPLAATIFKFFPLYHTLPSATPPENPPRAEDVGTGAVMTDISFEDGL